MSSAALARRWGGSAPNFVDALAVQAASGSEVSLGAAPDCAGALGDAPTIARCRDGFGVEVAEGAAGLRPRNALATTADAAISVITCRLVISNPSWAVMSMVIMFVPSS